MHFYSEHNIHLFMMYERNSSSASTDSPEMHEAQMIDPAHRVSPEYESSVSRKIPVDKILFIKTYYKKHVLWKPSLCMLNDTVIQQVETMLQFL